MRARPRRRVPAPLALAAGIVAFLAVLVTAPIVLAADTTPPAVTAPVISPNSAASGVTATVTATATDDVAVASAEMSVDGGAWLSMAASDGAFGGASEGLISSIGGPVRQVAAGFLHTCALLADGTVRCWGYNAQGQLGDGQTTTTQLTPVTVSGLSGVIALAAGRIHTCALLADTTVRCWGDNYPGQPAQPIPVAIAGLSGVTALAVGNSHTCALLADTTVRCWGDNQTGQLGDGEASSTYKTTPAAVVGLSGVTAIAAGTFHTCALLADTTVRCWGFDQSGQLGDGTTGPFPTQVQLSPVAVLGLSGVTAIATGSNHTCALLADTTVRCWGQNNEGEIGDGTSLTNRLTPVAVLGLSGATAIAAAVDANGPAHSCALLADTTVRCWGDNATGQLGDGTDAQTSPPGYRLTPVAVLGLSGITAISTGAAHTCALLADTNVRCWGYNGYGQLGDGTLGVGPNTDRVTPVAVVGLGALGNGTHSVCVRATDNVGNVSDGTACAPLTVGVTNHAPVGASDTYSANQGNDLVVPVASGVLANDTDPDAGTTLSAILVTGPAHGTLTLASNGSFRFTPVADYSGSDTFSYRASDGSLTSNLVTVTINVTGLPAIIDSQSQLTSGQGSSLKDKLAGAKAFFSSGKLNPACGKLSDFISQVNSLTPTKLSPQTAIVLINGANALRQLYGCP